MAHFNDRGEIIHSSGDETSSLGQSEPLSSSSGSNNKSLLFLLFIAGLFLSFFVIHSLTSKNQSPNNGINSGNLSETTNGYSAITEETDNNITPESKPIPTNTCSPTKTPVPTESKSYCPGAPKQHLLVNEDAKVCTKSDNVYLRSGPAKNNSVLSSVKTGTIVWILEGPQCADSWSWWKVKLSTGNIGWMAEGGDSKDDYFLCPN